MHRNDETVSVTISRAEAKANVTEEAIQTHAPQFWIASLRSQRRFRTGLLDSALAPIPQRIDEQRKGRRRLAAAWIPEVIA